MAKRPTAPARPAKAKAAETPAATGGAAGTASPPPDAAETRAYPVRSPLKRDGLRYAAGETIDLTEAEAETLVALGVLGEA